MKTFLVIGLTVLFTGCAGYNTGRIGHPQIDSIAVATVQNMTSRPELRVELQKGLRAAVQNNGAYKLKVGSSADCIIHTRVMSVETDGVGSAFRAEDKDNDSLQDYGSSIYRVTMQVEYTVLLPGKSRPLIPLTKVSGYGRFTEMGDIEVARKIASRSAAGDVAQQIISQITEAW